VYHNKWKYNKVKRKSISLKLIVTRAIVTVLLFHQGEVLKLGCFESCKHQLVT
jgi:hypothetical protein